MATTPPPRSDGAATPPLLLFESRWEAFVGRTVAERYRVVRLLGAGGMGAVFEAEHRFAGRRVALKLVPCGAADGEAAARWAREAAAPSAIGHPAIAEVYDAGLDPVGGVLYIAQELLRGANLRDVLARRGRLAAAEAVALLAPVMDALAAVHRAGLRHRDVKPANIVVLDDPPAGGAAAARLIDFGIVAWPAAAGAGAARLTTAGRVVGTPWYMAPEALRGGPAADGPGADVWAMGVVLFECLAGYAPFDGADGPDVARAVLAGGGAPPPALPADVPPALAAVVARALAHDPARRWPSMAALRAAARAAVAPAAVVAAAGDVVARGLGALARGLDAAAVAAAAARPTEALPRPVTLPAAPRAAAPPRGVSRRALAVLAAIGVAAGAAAGVLAAPPRDGSAGAPRAAAAAPAPAVAAPPAPVAAPPVDVEIVAAPPPARPATPPPPPPRVARRTPPGGAAARTPHPATRVGRRGAPILAP